MTEQSDQNEQAEQSAVQASVLSLSAVGRLLVEAREKMDLSVDEVASRLRLMPRQVRALESGDIDALPGPAFVRGFLRNYAKLLQLDAEPLLEACRVHGIEAAPKQISLHSENILIAGRERKSWAIYLAATVAVLLALAAWFAYMDAANDKGEPLPPAATAVPHDLPETVVVPPPIESLPPAAENAPAIAAEPFAVPQTVPAEPPLQTPASDTAKLTLAAGQTSWVSVRDRDGKEIFSGDVTAGSSQTINGVPPLKVVVGNAADVKLTFNDSPVDLAPHIRANIARLTLE